MVSPAHDEWVQCPPGELSRLATRLRGRRQRRIVVQTSALVLLVAVGLGGLVLWPRPQGTGDYNYAGIMCSRVMQLADAYAAGELTTELREQVRQHVAQCPNCGPKFKEMGLTAWSGPPAEIPTAALRLNYAALAATNTSRRWSGMPQSAEAQTARNI